MSPGEKSLPVNHLSLKITASALCYCNKSNRSDEGVSHLSCQGLYFHANTINWLNNIHEKLVHRLTAQQDLLAGESCRILLLLWLFTQDRAGCGFLIQSLRPQIYLYLHLDLIIYIYTDISAYLFQASWKDSILFYLKQSIVIKKKNYCKWALSTPQLWVLI